MNELEYFDWRRIRHHYRYFHRISTDMCLLLTPPSSFCTVIAISLTPSGNGPTKCFISSPFQRTAPSPLIMTLVPGSTLAWISTMCPCSTILSIVKSGIAGIRVRAADSFREGRPLALLCSRRSVRTLSKAVASNAAPMQTNTAGLRANLLAGFDLLFTNARISLPNCETAGRTQK